MEELFTGKRLQVKTVSRNVVRFPEWGKIQSWSITGSPVNPKVMCLRVHIFKKQQQCIIIKISVLFASRQFTEVLLYLTIFYIVFHNITVFFKVACCVIFCFLIWITFAIYSHSRKQTKPALKYDSSCHHLPTIATSVTRISNLWSDSWIYLRKKDN